MSYDGMTFGNRVDHFSERKLHAKVVDSVLSTATLYSRLAGMGKEMVGKTYDYTLKITNSDQGQYYTGLEVLNSSAADTTIQLSYAHAAFSQPVVAILAESMANQGPTQTIDLDQFKIDEAVAEAINTLGAGAYAQANSKAPNSLAEIVSDSGTIGGQSRSTYTALNSTATDSGGTLSLSKMATLWSDISDVGATTEQPSVLVGPKDIFDLYELLLNPTVRASYEAVGYDRLPVRGKSAVKNADLRGGAGFLALSYRGIPLIADEFATAQTLFALNENYLTWMGRTIVPSKYKGQLERVSVGVPSTMEGAAAAPSDNHGWFWQKQQMLPNQAGMIGRYHVYGQLCTSQPRRHGKLTGITSV